MVRLFVICICFFFITSCKKDPITEPSLYSGEATALKNGEAWVGELRFQGDQEGNIIIDGQVRLIMDVFNEHGFRRESLGIAEINRISNSQVILSSHFFELFELDQVMMLQYCFIKIS